MAGLDFLQKLPNIVGKAQVQNPSGLVGSVPTNKIS